MEEERDAAEHVKREVPILVVLGNPPYNGFAGVAVAEERDLSNAYRTTKHAPAPQGQGLNDLYVRFLPHGRAAHRGDDRQGRSCFISNYSWLDGLSFTGMRERYLEAFSSIWIDNLHGDRIISEYAPDGQTSETVFAAQGHSPGIKIGTAIAILSAAAPSDKRHPLRYRDMYQARASDRRTALLASLNASSFSDQYAELVPELALGLPLKPSAVGSSYLSWPLLPDLFPTFFAGVNTKRDDLVIDIDREKLVERMHKYFDPEISHGEIAQTCPRAMEKTARFDAKGVRDYLLKRGLLADNILPHVYRPFDVRWLYWEPETRLLGEKSPDYFPHAFVGNISLVSQQKPRREWSRPQLIRSMGSLDLMDRGASCIPLYLKPDREARPLLAAHQPVDPRTTATGLRLNITDSLLSYLAGIGTIDDAPHVFFHGLAILHAPAYRNENAGALRQDWPRIPLPNARGELVASADLGRRVAALLDAETPAEAVEAPSLQVIAAFKLLGQPPLDETEHFAIAAGWGHLGPGGVTMPAKGRTVERDFTAQERESMGEAVKLLGDRHPGCLPERLGVLGERPGAGVGLHHRRVSGHQKMAVLPRSEAARSSSD